MNATRPITPTQAYPHWFSDQLSVVRATPRFGGTFEKLGSSLDKFIPITQNITEDFFWQFITLDVLGLWVTRIWNSLARGRKPYHPNEDPTWNPNLSEKQQLGKLVAGTVKGLNWGYFGEEAGREFLIGAGVLGIFGSLYGVYRLLLNPTLRLPAKTLQNLNDSFGQYLFQTVGNKRLSSQEIPAMAKQFILHQITNPNLKAAVAQPLSEWTDSWQAHLQTLSDYGKAHNKPQQWLHSWQYWGRTRPFQNPANATKGLTPAHLKLLTSQKTLETKAAAFTEAVLTFNRYQNPSMAYDKMHQISLLIQERFKGGLKGTEQFVDVEHWVNWLTQWQHVPTTLIQNAHAQPAKPTVALLSSLVGSLNRTKIVTVVTAMFICGSYLGWLTRLFQNSKKYPGNRERRASDLKDELKNAMTHHRKPPMLPMGGMT